MSAKQSNTLMTDSPHGVITFYSYKGGTGRTMALANIACLFAQQNKRVLVIDWDLEAPGLHYYLPSSGSEAVNPNSAGVVEYFTHALELVESTTREDDEDSYAEHILAQIPFCEFRRETNVANIDLMPAGRFGSTGCPDQIYQRQLAKIDWQRLYEKAPAIFRIFAHKLATEYDIVFIDSRTGMTDISSICTALLPDMLVVVFTPNQQSLAGIEQLVLNNVRYRQESRDLRPLMVYPLPSRIDAERDKLRELWRHGDLERNFEGFQPQFERILQASYVLESCDLTSYFDEVQIQHSPDYSYGEEVASREAADADRFSIIRSYQALVQWLQCSALPWESPENAMDRKRLDGLLLLETDMLSEASTTSPLDRIDLQEKIVSLAMSQRGSHHPDTVSATERLIQSCFLQATSLPRAMKLLEQIAQGISQMRDPIKLKALGVILNGSKALRGEGRALDADHLVQLIATSLRESFSNIDANTVDLVEYLADRLYVKHALIEAQTLQDFAEQRHRQLLGTEHTNTLRSMEKLAYTLSARGNLSDARKLLEQVLDIRCRVLGEEHADTIRTKNYLNEMLRRTKLFLASPTELKEDRKEFESFIHRKNKDWAKQGVVLELVIWEDFLDAISQSRLKDEYNKAIRECDIFVMLFFTTVGQYTGEEFETAFGQFKATDKPFIFTYFKDAEISTGKVNENDMTKIYAFQDKLDSLGHPYTRYKTIDELTNKFNRQLDELVANGSIKLKQGQDGNALVGGSGAIAQADSEALGGRSVKLNGDNAGTINTGLQVITHNYAMSGQNFSKEDIARQVSAYLRWLQTCTASIELRGIERAGGAPVVVLPLETAYVPLRAKAMPRMGEGLNAMDAKSRPKRPQYPGEEAEADERETDISLDQVLGLAKRLVIIGGPGSGKTTVLLHMAWALASSLLAGTSEPARSRLGLDVATNELPLPIFVPLASFARYRRNLPLNAPARNKTLAFFISDHLISKQADFDLPADFFLQLLKDGRDVILLLDGLDEVANEDERAEVRQSVEELVGGREAMRVVVTCRTIAYRSGRTALGADFREVTVQPLDLDRHIAPMVRQAYACIYPHDAAQRGERRDDLLRGIERLEAERRERLGDDAAALVDSPLMVRLLLIVHFNNRTLPDERADLFDKAINALLQVDYGREESNIRELSTDWKLYRDMAQHLAFHMHSQGSDQGREIGEAALKQILRQEAEFLPRIGDFLTHARQRGSVLEERDGGYRFIHLAFQEFLVARYLREVIGGEGREAILACLQDWLDDPWWREPVLLLIGYMGANAAKSAREFILALVKSGKTANAQFSAAELAGMAALEWHESGVAIKTECAGRILALLNHNDALKQSKPVIRARAGDRLAQLGDPRFDPQRFYLPNDDLLGFVRIPADPNFMIGTRAKDFDRVMEVVAASKDNKYFFKDEINDELTPTSEFYIARYPVTVAQFRAFVEATGFKLGDEDALRDPDSRPVRWVSWHEALAYCDWLNDALGKSPLTPPIRQAQDRLLQMGEWRVTLPSELEWEKAARGGLEGTIFPWGDVPDMNQANYHDSKIGNTSAYGDSNIGNTSTVGCFPPNEYGLHDMVGNVWEWTRSLWGFEYPYPMGDLQREDLKAGNDKSRVVRGGSWSNDRVSARCAVRRGYRPGYRYVNYGFRVVLLCSAPVL